MKRYIALFLSAYLTVTVGFAMPNETSPTLSLSEAIEQGLAHNYDIKMARFDAEISKRQTTLGQAGFLPKLSVDGYIAESRGDSDSTYSSGSTENVSNAKSTSNKVSVSVNQILFRGFGGFATLQRLDAFATLSELETRYIIEQKVTQIIAAYVDIVRLKEDVSIANEAVQVSHERFMRSKSSGEYGRISKIEVLDAEADWESDKGTAIEKNIQLQNAKRQLNFLMARSIDTPFVVESDVFIAPNLDYDTLLDQAYEFGVTMLTVAGKDYLEDAEAKLVYASLFPTISLSGGYSISNSDSGSGFISASESNQFEAQLSVSVPIFDGFKRLEALSQLDLTTKKTDVDADKMEAEVAHLMAQEFALYQGYLRLLDLSETTIATAQASFDRASELYKLGQITGTDLREIQLNLMRAKNKKANYLFLGKLSETNLKRLSGQLLI